ncbi:MAG: DUF5667 domain-containing protein [Bacillota bacterium]
MDNLEKILMALPENKLSRKADRLIKFRLEKTMVLSYFKRVAEGPQVPWPRAIVAGLALFMIFIATSVYAYASDKILPGDRIYPLKRAVEKIEEAVTPGTAKIKVYEKHSSRRLQEARDLSTKTAAVSEKSAEEKAKDSENIKKNIDSAVIKQQAIVEKINKLDDYDKAVKTIDKAKKADKKKTEYLGQIINNAKTEKDEERIKKAEQAYESIDKAEYKVKDKKIKEEKVKEDKGDKGGRNKEKY